jgi:hypothetical protein
VSRTIFSLRSSGNSLTASSKPSTPMRAARRFVQALDGQLTATVHALPEELYRDAVALSGLLPELVSTEPFYFVGSQSFKVDHCICSGHCFRRL